MPDFAIRPARPAEFAAIGQLLVQVYSQLEGFPQPAEQPAYYDFLANIGQITTKPGVALLVVAGEDDRIAGAVVFVGDMRHYSPLGVAADETQAAGFRLLGVAPWARGRGVGKLLTQACIDRARAQGTAELIIHSTEAMRVAWQLYAGIGFRRAPELDFWQDALRVYGFRLPLR